MRKPGFKKRQQHAQQQAQQQHAQQQQAQQPSLHEGGIRKKKRKRQKDRAVAGATAVATADPPQQAPKPAMAASTATTAASATASNPHSRTSSTTRAHLTDVAFASLPISPLTKRAVAEVLRYDKATAVQAQTLPVALEGHDLIAKARTGTGKTIAFLLPTIERLVARGGGGGVRALAISPTRELASQICAEAEQLLTYHHALSARAVRPMQRAQTPRARKADELALCCAADAFGLTTPPGQVVGGTKVEKDVAGLTARPPALLVATPGRLNDLLYEQVALRCTPLALLHYLGLAAPPLP